jgi:hypothetical protein
VSRTGGALAVLLWTVWTKQINWALTEARRPGQKLAFAHRGFPGSKLRSSRNARKSPHDFLNRFSGTNVNQLFGTRLARTQP